MREIRPNLHTGRKLGEQLMTDNMQVSVDPNSRGNVNLVYILYLVGIVVGITSIVGVVMAYIGKGKGDAFIDSHYNNQINIFWKMLLYSVIGLVLTFVLIGILVLLGALIWYIIRCVKGMQALSAGQPIANPGSWGL
jgi:uncharacterized membrane protein